MIGPKHPSYNTNLSDEERLADRNFIFGYHEWKQQVKALANYTCVKCNRRGGKLNAHHIESYHANKELRLDLSNGACLCEVCHKVFHKLNGRKNNTRAQFAEYIKSK